MLINIEIEKTQPLTGTASSDGRGPVSFVGWMALLRVVAELTEAMEQVEDAARHDDEGPPVRHPDPAGDRRAGGRGGLVLGGQRLRRRQREALRRALRRSGYRD